MIDRDVDKISPFYLTQTYEGLLDEFFGINTTCVKVANEIVYTNNQDRDEVEKTRFSNKSDDIYNTYLHLASESEHCIRKGDNKSLHKDKMAEHLNREISLLNKNEEKVKKSGSNEI